MGYGADEEEQWRRAAVIADKVLRGAKPADLPMEQPTKVKFVINLIWKDWRQRFLHDPPLLFSRRLLGTISRSWQRTRDEGGFDDESP